MRSALAIMVPTLVLAGCLDPASTQVTGTDIPTTPSQAGAVVVALVDSGINPWHDAFRWDAPATNQLLSAATTVPRPASPEGDGTMDWNSLQTDTLYWFENTRVLAISMKREFDDPPPEPLDSILFPEDPNLIFDDVNHGTGTSSMVAQTSPNAWIVMVETDILRLDAYRWVAEQPWIDVISVSIGTLGHLPSNLTEGPNLQAEAFRQATESGKLVVLAGGNEPDPNLMSNSGAPWVISVGGAEGDRQGSTALASQPTDVVANFTARGLARNSSDTGTYTGKGTSFGAPLVAGVLAEALHGLRQASGEGPGVKEDGALVHTPQGPLTNRDLRWALNMSARYWHSSEWDPTGTNTSAPITHWPYEVTTPAAPHVEGTPVGPWTSMGWGYVDASTAQDIVRLLRGETAPPDKADATAYMEALFAARSAVWDAYQGQSTP